MVSIGIIYIGFIYIYVYTFLYYSLPLSPFSLHLPSPSKAGQCPTRPPQGSTNAFST
jgi:hypothetical protein